MRDCSQMLLRTATAALAVFALVACQKDGGGGGAPTPNQAQPVEKVVRDFYGAYTGAATGDQARAALEGNGAPAFVDGLKAKAQQCASSHAPECEADPVICSDKKVSLTTVVVQSVGKEAVATAVVTPDGGAPVNVRVTLAGDPWKISAIDCPK